MFPKSLLTLFVWLSATVCLAEEPSFPQQAEGVDPLENQYIIQFDDTDHYEQAKLSILNDDSVQVARYIDTRNIVVYAFSSRKTATKWRNDAVGVKYFEEGEKRSAYTFKNASPPPRKGGLLCSI